MARSKEPTCAEKIAASSKLLATFRHRALEQALVERYQKPAGRRRWFPWWRKSEPPAAPSEHPQSIWLQFSGLPRQRFACSGDGSSLAVDQDAPLPVDMGELGRTVIFDGSSNEALARCLGRTVEQVDIVVDEYSVLVGACFEFSGGELLCLLRWGDELRVTSSRPESTERDPLELRPLLE